MSGYVESSFLRRAVPRVQTTHIDILLSYACTQHPSQEFLNLLSSLARRGVHTVDVTVPSDRVRSRSLKLLISRIRCRWSYMFPVRVEAWDVYETFPYTVQTLALLFVVVLVGRSAG